MWKSVLLCLLAVFVKCSQKNGDLYLWIDEQQVKMFSGEYVFHVLNQITNHINIQIT